MEHIRGHLWHRLPCFFPRSWLIIGCVTRLTHLVSLVKQERLTLPENLSSPPAFSGGSCYSIFSFICMFCRSLFVLFYSYFCPLCCLFFEIRILNTRLVFSNSSLWGGQYTFFDICNWDEKNPNKGITPLFKFSEVSNYIFFCIWVLPCSCECVYLKKYFFVFNWICLIMSRYYTITAFWLDQYAYYCLDTYNCSL